MLLQTTLAATEQSKAQTEQDLSKQLEELEQKLETLIEEKQSTETHLKQILDDLHRKMLSKMCSLCLVLEDMFIMFAGRIFIITDLVFCDIIIQSLMQQIWLFCIASSNS